MIRTTSSRFLAATAAAAASIALGSVMPAAQAALPPAPPGVTITTDLPYLAPDRKERMDLYMPSDRPAGKKSPGVVIIHGGGWTSGNKQAIREFEIGTTLAKAGYVCISIDYRLDPHERWPTNIYDCKNAVRYLRANAAKYGIDAAHIGVIGGSAGGHLVLMLGTTADVKELEPAGSDTPYPGISDRVQAVVDMYGIANLPTAKRIAPDGTPTTPKPYGWDAVFGDHKPITEADRLLASPESHLDSKTAPIMILHGTKDTTVDRDQSIDLDKALEAKGIPHKLIMVEGAGHTFDLERQVNHKPLPNGVDLRPEVLAFFGKYLKGETAK